MKRPLMRSVDYILLPPVGSQETPVRGSVADLLRDIPYLLIGGLIPPLPVANEVLGSGLDDAGMSGGCRWEPLELSEREFDEVLHDLQTAGDRTGRPLRFEAPPSWVATRSDWDIWVAERVYSIPASENRRLRNAMDEIETAMKAAAASGDEDSRVELLCRLSELSSEWSDFVRDHRKPPHGDEA